MTGPLLTTARLEELLARLPGLAVGVVGDLFLDQYFDLDAALTETSLETGLPAYQVAAMRHSPGAAGTIVTNLVGLGVGRVCILSCIGDDGHGWELRRALEQRGVDLRFLLTTAERVTPTYLKPLLQGGAETEPRELNRFDIKNRTPTPATVKSHVLQSLPALWQELDALIISDQVSEPECGLITAAVREQLTILGAASPTKVLLADSRERIGQFRQVWLKPNERECLQASPGHDLASAVEQLVNQGQRPVFCTRGPEGILLGLPDPPRQIMIPGYPVTGPLDTVGAGDSTSAGIAVACAAGATLEEAAAFGCLVASVTVQQLGTTGFATPTLLRQRWAHVTEGIPR